MQPADNKPAQLTVQSPAETEVGPHVNPNRHVPMVPADHHSVNDDEFLVAHGLVLNALTLYYARHRGMGRVRIPYSHETSRAENAPFHPSLNSATRAGCLCTRRDL